MGIATSNKPAGGGKPKGSAASEEKAKWDAVYNSPEFKADLEKAATEIGESLRAVAQTAAEAEFSKIRTFRTVGEREHELLARTGGNHKKPIVQRFCDETGQSPQYFYHALTFAERFSEEDAEKLIDAQVTMRVVYALVSIKDDKLREKVFQKVLKDGLTEVDIRKLVKTGGTRKDAAAKAMKKAESEKPPIRVFNKTQDRLDAISAMVSASTDAISRISQLESEEDKGETLVQLEILRNSALALSDELKAFIAFSGKALPKQAGAGKVQKS